MKIVTSFLCLVLVFMSCAICEAMEEDWSKKFLQTLQSPHVINTNPTRRDNEIELCSLIKENWQKGADLDQSLINLDNMMHSIGATLSSSWGTRKGYISFYFVPDKSTTHDVGQLNKELAQLIELGGEERDEYHRYFQENKVGFWPDEWGQKQYFKEDHGYIRLDMQAYFSALIKYENGTLPKEPPPYLSKLIKEQKLDFKYSADRGLFSYVYTRDLADVTKSKANQSYLAISISLSGQRTAEGLKSIEMKAATCLYPMPSASWGMGPKPAATGSFPQRPIDIPCNEYLEWYKCNKVEAGTQDLADQCIKAPSAPPVCKDIK